MGTLVPAGRDAPLKLAEALQNNQHVAMLVDQYLTNGVDLTFFGRKTKANPTLARLLRQVDCPVHGVRIIRLPNHRFRAELSEEVKPVRDASGQIDIAGTMQAVTSVIEGWVREYPDQWLWLHRRWRCGNSSSLRAQRSNPSRRKESKSRLLRRFGPRNDRG